MISMLLTRSRRWGNCWRMTRILTDIWSDPSAGFRIKTIAAMIREAGFARVAYRNMAGGVLRAALGLVGLVLSFVLVVLVLGAVVAGFASGVFGHIRRLMRVALTLVRYFTTCCCRKNTTINTRRRCRPRIRRFRSSQNGDAARPRRTPGEGA